MLAIGMLPRVTTLRPCASGACAVNGEFQAVEVCTGTMMVWPSTVTALWSLGPAPPLRLAAPALGSTSRSPKDCNSVISWRFMGRVWFMVVAPGSGKRSCIGLRHAQHGHGGPVVEQQAQQLGPGVVTDRIHHAFALGDQRHVQV